MKFTAVAVLAAATGAMAYPGNVTVVTEVVESFVTYCPSPTTITYGSSTITVTEVGHFLIQASDNDEANMTLSSPPPSPSPTAPAP